MNLTLDEFASLGEALSGLAVVVSLLYVGFELRANTRSVRASSAALSQDSLAAMNEMIAAESGLASLLTRADREGSRDKLDADEAFRVTLLLRSNMQRFEAMYFRYAAGLLEEKVWLVRRNWLAGWLKTPLVADWWRTERHSSLYTDKFIADVESAAGAPVVSPGQRSPHPVAPTSDAVTGRGRDSSP
jgi:hypothetical protein